MESKQLVGLVLGTVVGVSFAPVASAVLLDGTLPDAYYTTYGDAQVYSLGSLAYIYCRQQTGGSCGGASTTPYNIDSTPGAIKDLVVIATGASGAPVTTNVSGMDNVYGTPSGASGDKYFSTTSATQPTSAGGTYANLSGSWDASVAALMGQFGANQVPMFMFNNNQLDRAVNLAAWGRVWVSDNAGNAVTGQNYYLTNQRIAGNPNTYLDPILQHSGGGIDFNEAGGTSPWSSFTGSGTAPVVGANNQPFSDPTNPTPPTTDYVLSGSDYCIHNTTFLPVACTDPNSSPKIKNNLGANEVAYAVLFPELNAWLAGLHVADRAAYTLHVDFRLGCQDATGADKPATDTSHCRTNFPGTTGFDSIDTRSINNGYEQLFIVGVNQAVPEPGMLALLGIAFGGLALTRRRVG